MRYKNLFLTRLSYHTHSLSFSSTFANTYAIALGLWPIYVPGLFEQSLIMLLTVMKYVYDAKEARNDLISKEEGPMHYSEMSATIKAFEEDAFDVEAATLSNNKNNCNHCGRLL